MLVSFNAKSFQKTMNNILDYSYGFLDGAEKGKKLFLSNLGISVIQILKQYIDIEAKANPKALHHIYEWYQTGRASSRLFEIDYIVNKNGLTLTSYFKQSRTLSRDANVPFYDKARIMEDGIPVTIKPKKSVLVFNESGQTIFTKKTIQVRDPGGDEVQGSFESVVDEFILKYFKQSFLKASGIYDYIKKPKIYKKNIKKGAKLGRSAGISTGFQWIINAKAEVY
jgi:hypothetical protein